MTASAPAAPPLTDAQYLAAARVILGLAPTNTAFADAEVLARLSEVCDPNDLKAALAIAIEAGRESLRDRASDPAVVTAVAGRLVGLLDRGVAKPQAANVIAVVLDALEVDRG